MRIGIGFDVHRLVAGRKLILAGVEIPFDKGLWGHSDGDVLTHALVDALLGAAGLRDIGFHFPDTNPKLKDISSLVILKEVAGLLTRERLVVSNVDTTVVLEQPKLADSIEAMKDNLALVLRVDPSRIGIKAKTSEGLGFTGRGEGIAAYAVACLSEAVGSRSETDRGLSREK